MNKEHLIDKNLIKSVIIYFILFLIMVFGVYFYTKYLPKNSFGADNQNMFLQANIEKYINFKISDQDKGTLLQYNIKTGMKYQQDEEEYIPLKQSQIKLELNQIDGKYPYDIKLIPISTEATNGKKDGIKEEYRYNAETGILLINTSNIDENGELINTEKITDAKDEYTVICYYDSYIEEPTEREIEIKGTVIGVLLEEDRLISVQENFKGQVKENLGELTSIEYNTEKVANGYIKSNIINGTDYNTEYKETQKIMISKKEAQKNIELNENNTFISIETNENGEEIETDLGNNNELVYKSTKIKKENIIKLLGENGKLEILDSEKNLIATIDENTEFVEDGTITIVYETNVKSIVLKTSDVQSEGILEIENTKEIKNTMNNAINTKIKTEATLIGLRENTNNINNEQIGTTVFTNKYEHRVNIEDAKSNINFEINNSNWINKEQNEITFDVHINSNTINDNMLKNPTFKIELPNEVEKVILNNSYVSYANGLELQNPYIETNENGNKIIIANLIGEQTEYNENNLGLVTDLKIDATIILKKDIESVKSNVNLTYTNEFSLNGEKEVIEKNLEVQISSYLDEDIVQEQPVRMLRQAVSTETQEETENIDGLQLEVTPVKGDTVLNDGDTVYEGEFIKYNIKVTNTSDRQIDNIKIVGTIPEGTTYGELEADYHNVWGKESEDGKYDTGKYEYNYDDSVKEKTIEIGTLKSGESRTDLYEVNVNNLNDSEEQQTNTTIKLYENNNEVTNYQINNIIKHSEIKLFMDAYIDGTGKKGWTYRVYLISDNEQTVNVKVKLPKEFNIIDVITVTDPQEIIKNKSISDDNNVNITVAVSPKNGNSTAQLNEELGYGSGPNVGPGNIIYIQGEFDDLKVENKTEDSEILLKASASVQINNAIYNSNENRIIYGYDNVLIEMTSENEGEEVKYKDKINYEIKIRNIGKSNLSGYATKVNLMDYLPKDLEPIRLRYDSWKEELKEIDLEENIYEGTGTFTKITTEKDLTIKHLNSEGEELPEVDIEINIPYGETAIINIEATAGAVFEKTKIENVATISGDSIGTKTTNTISHIILPHNYIYNNTIEEPDNPDDPDNPDNPEDPSDETHKYSISGVVWLDENQDGQRQTSEKLLNGINVMLVDISNASIIKERINTDANGTYIFSNLEQGRYIVVFNYDVNTYSLTEYQKTGVSTSLNSDAMSKEITLLGSNTKVGLTDIISLDASVKNVDIGLIKNKVCDLKLDKYISKVRLETSSGTKEQSYNNSQLAKVEIKSKEIQGAKVLVEYKLVVTNEGEIPTSVNKVIDYIPDGLQFSSEFNEGWNINNKGELINTSLSSQKIDPGKSAEVTLILTKSMTSNSTGTFTNSAEIAEINNSLGINDIDSTPGNKSKTEDDYSKADLIISVSTGVFMYISIIMCIVVLLGIILYINAKFGFWKISKLLIIMTIIIPTIFIFTANSYTAAASTNYMPDKAYFYNPNVNDSGSIFIGYYHSGGKTIDLNGTCGLRGGYATDYTEYGTPNYTTFVKLFEISDDKNKKEIPGSEKTIGKIKISKKETTKFTMKQEEDNFILGPFEISSSNAISYSYSVKTNKGKKIEDLKPYNKTNVNSSGGFTFYLKISTSKINVKQGDFIKWVYLEASKNDLKTTKDYNIPVEAHYKPTTEHTNGNWGGTTTLTYHEKKYSGWLYQEKFYQPVIASTTKKATITTGDTTDKKTLEWEYEFSNLQLEKQDKNDSNLKLAGVQFKITGPSFKNGITLTTGTDGKTEELTNIIPGEYTIVEVYNPYYGYTQYTDEKRTINPGTNIITCNNTKKTGNLVIEKKDTDTDEKIEGIGFILQRIKKEDKVKKENDYYGYVEIVDNDKKVDKCTGQIHVDEKNIRYVSNKEDATEFITDSNGRIEINNILNGWYEVEETSVGDNIKYDIDENYISWSYNSTGNEKNSNGKASKDKSKLAEIWVFARDSRNTTENPIQEDRDDILTFNNTKKFIKVSGYAWEDNITGKKSERNNKYDGEGTDKRLAGIKVNLYKSNGELIDTRITDSNGEYIFGDYENGNKKIETVDLEGAYIEFEYNGMSYETTDIVTEKNGKVLDNSSKVVENLTKDVRNEVSKTRNDFNNNYAIIENNKSNSKTLKYSYENHASKLIYGDNVFYGYEGQKYPVSGVYDQYVMTANTYDANSDKLLGQDKTIKEILKEGKDEIENINLGLRLREQPDLELIEDVENAKISLNGYEHTYEYGTRNEILNDEIKKFDEEQTNLYPEDESLRENFNVSVSFGSKYGPKSYTREVYSSDVCYDIQNKGKLEMYINYRISLRNTSTNLYSKINELVSYYDDRYTIESITDAQSNKINYVKDSQYHKNGYYKVIINSNMKIEHQKQDYIYITYKLNDEAIQSVLNREITLNTLSEITSYSTYEDENYEKVYGGIDKDSNPGSTKEENDETYEDDTDLAPSFIVKVKEGRVIQGTVWEDNSTVDENKERKGDGEYKEKEENTVGNATVELIDVTKDNYPIAKLYKKDGTVEDATTTTNSDGTYEFSGVIPEKYLIRYTYGNNSIIYNINDNTSKNIDILNYKSTIYRGGNKDEDKNEEDLYWYGKDKETGENATRLSDAKDDIKIIENRTKNDSNEIINYKKAMEGTSLTEINADTKKFEIDMEYDLDKISSIGEELKFVFDNIDFGIVRRPKQVAEVSKKITWIEITLANGQTVVSGNPQEVKMKNVQLLGDKNVWVQLDSELLQGATLKVRYTISVDSSETEKDYLDEDYYIYGIKPNDDELLRKVQIAKLCDYVQNDFVFDANNEYNKEWTDVEISSDQKDEDFSQDAYDAIKTYNHILETNVFKDGETSEATIELSRLLANSEEISIRNDIEINQLIGSKLDNSIPGNYVPGKAEQTSEPDDDNAFLSITTPTGKTDNTIQIVIMIISLLVILGTGIIFIKKKILR